MNRRILVVVLLTVVAILTGCSSSGGYHGSGGSGSGPSLVQLTQPPPQVLQMGTTAGLVAQVFNDTNNAGVTWSCTPVGACGSFNPTTTPFQIDTLYTAPVPPPNGPITPNLNYSVTITATSVADSSLSASATVSIAQQYGFVLAGFASLGMVGSVTLDGNGNIISGEADWSQSGQYSPMTLTGTYALDSTGHGSMTLNLINTIFGSFPQTQSITATSSSHLVIAEADQFNGLTIGGVGSMDLQTAAPFSAAQVSGGYSFGLSGFDGAANKAGGGTGLNGSWGGIFTADGVGTIGGGIFDTNTVGGAPSYSSTPFTGTFTPPDVNGRGTMDLTNGTSYAYYIVTPEVLRLTTINDVANPANVSNAANTGSAYGQGSVAATSAALTGSYVFADFGFDVPGNAMGAAGQFTTDGSGNINAGITDVNDSGAGVLVTGQSLAGSTYTISGSPRGTVTGSSGQTYNVYLTDPNLNLLDPNNPSGAGGALFLESDGVYSTIGTVIPQNDPASAILDGAYAILLSDQNNPANLDGGFTGQFTTTSGAAGVFSGEGDFQGMGNSNATLITGPLNGTFTADSSNLGRFTGTITTAPAFPNANVGDTTPGTEQVSFYLANGAQGFAVETDLTAPVWGVLESQVASDPAAAAKRQRANQRQSHPANLPRKAGAGHSRISGPAGSRHE
jgi:hypothetical protein